ncbi:MAG: hypothetical protein CMM33_08610 [Rhodospirillaceae bacterium]|nr:hypothetical protein [Rhodospirillaceae bacterium]|tara:strand:- start:662 stop:1840 length:1179 start_codon:yes stop_codon:yes gene_type:complete
MKTIKLAIFLVILLAQNAFADTETTADVTEKSSGATHVCGRNNAECTYDPRSDIYSDGGSDDDVVYWDSHGGEWRITNDINSFMTEEQMLQGFTMDSSVGLRDRNYIGGDAFTVEIKVTDGTTTYSDTAEFTTSAGEAYQTITSQLIVPENALAYSLATFGLILEGVSASGGYNGPQTNAINLTSTYELINNVEDTVLDLVANAVDDILTDTGVSAIDTATMEIDIATPSGTESISVGVTATPTAVTLSVPTVAGKIETIQINTGMASADSQPEPVAEVAEAIAEVESAQKEEKEETKETKSDKAKAVQAIVTRVLQAVSMAGGDTDSTKLALMGILGTPGFRSYQQQEIPDVAFYDTTVAYESTSYIDPLGSVLSLGSDSMMNEMIDLQYK